VVFHGVLKWEWDPDPNATARYGAPIPIGADLSAGPLLVIDYLVMVPDPRVITEAELKQIKEEIWNPDRQDAVVSFLEQHDKALLFFQHTSWDVRSGT
jgi:hypothetical protein